MPYYRKDVPLGSNAMLDHDEYILAKKNSQKNIERYKKSVAEMELKKEELYEINTPVPNSRHSYCNICRVLF